MEYLSPIERAMERERNRLDPSSMQPAVVNSLEDIKRVIAEFDPAHSPVYQDVPLTADVEADDDGKRHIYRVSVNTRSKTKREMLLQGMEYIRSQHESAASLRDDVQEVEINGRVIRPATMDNSSAGSSWVDPLIKQWTGGVRKGMFITWVMDDMEYRYDIYNHKLGRVTRAHRESAAGAVPAPH